jgi:hypothetical protein
MTPGRRVFFFVNKKEAKKTLLIRWGRAGAKQTRSGAEVFLVLFFQKKNCLLPFPSHPTQQRI